MSRTALTLGLFLAPAPAAAQSVLPLDADVLGPIARRQALEGGAGSRAPDCAPSSGDEEIVVCAPARSTSFRVPYEPEPGAPQVRAMGELPRAVPSFEECHRLCPSSVGISINVGRLISDPGGVVREIFRGRR